MLISQDETLPDQTSDYIIRENVQDVHNYFGLIKCRVLPPANLYHLMLPNTSTPICVSTQNSKGLFTERLEQSKLLTHYEKGYRISEIKEIWHFDETTDSLFTDYISYVNFFCGLSLKVRAGLYG